MGEAFGTTYSVMQQSEQLFKSKHREMTELLDRLEGELESGLARWEDTAKDAYMDARAKWDKAAREMAKAVKEFSESIGVAHDNYQKAEQSNSKIWT
ncbi:MULTISPECIES: WXG100 family type VII secretion target [Actinomadura]|uniref:ESAT-6-like protein n=1 Tax=Actinomadura yumaensis TaxID=111807 RepID=A0ABW2CEQ0_9ACTN|nr:WXG100 family type VII secretion target [Actinomadura sp. J1-007]MWK34508.1 WXG100 family type VII secretion target [Actinomadura sp. J1-007]